MVKIRPENQVVIAYEVYEQRPNDKDLLVPSVRKYTSNALTGFPPWLPATPASTPQTEKRKFRHGVKAPLRSQWFHQEHGEAPVSKATLVPQGTKVENRLRRSESAPLKRRPRAASMRTKETPEC